MSLTTLSSAAGGLALFLLAMLMMTEGLKTSGGSSLKHLLSRWSSSPVRGVAAGVLVTALVQSSSAVTVATIGFVNAGVLSLRQALGVIFGTNVGTTITGWLVSLVGFGFRIESFALPEFSSSVRTEKMPRGGSDGLSDALRVTRECLQTWPSTDVLGRRLCERGRLRRAVTADGAPGGTRNRDATGEANLEAT